MDLAVTTQKDMVKIDSDTQLRETLEGKEVAVMGITIKWENETAVRNLLSSVLSPKNHTGKPHAPDSPSENSRNKCKSTNYKIK
ncbi:MAG: hypothetical protein CSB22_00745 [Deltaproteobacteria bacterium]|nr:MAG: hypothetical protein CSB22_00745 [Deltaproteobacteria bacterium]